MLEKERFAKNHEKSKKREENLDVNNWNYL